MGQVAGVSKTDEERENCVTATDYVVGFSTQTLEQASPPPRFCMV
jgi:hypothetical protein